MACKISLKLSYKKVIKNGSKGKCKNYDKKKQQN